MEKVLPVKMKVTIGLMLLIGVFYLWDWFDDGKTKTEMLVAGAAHVVLGVGLLLKINAGRVVTLLVSVGGVFFWLVITFFLGLIDYSLNFGDKRADAVVLPDETAGLREQAASGVLTAFQTLPWLVAVMGLVFILVYGWIFYYLTTDEAHALFRKSDFKDGA